MEIRGERLESLRLEDLAASDVLRSVFLVIAHVEPLHLERGRRVGDVALRQHLRDANHLVEMPKMVGGRSRDVSEERLVAAGRQVNPLLVARSVVVQQLLDELIGGCFEASLFETAEVREKIHHFVPSGPGGAFKDAGKLVEGFRPVPVQPRRGCEVVSNDLADQELHAFLTAVGVYLFFGAVAAVELGLFHSLEIGLLPGSVPGEHGRLFVVTRHGEKEIRRDRKVICSGRTVRTVRYLSGEKVTLEGNEDVRKL